MMDAERVPAAAEDEEFSAAAPPHPGARGTGETSFGDAEAPGAGPGRAGEAAPGDGAQAPDEAPSDGEAAPAPEPDKAAAFLELAKRTQADFDNYRKRMAREQAGAVDRGVSKLAKELLPALDHLDLALRAAAGHEDVIRGFSMVRDELVTALRKVGIEPFSPAGEPFDPSEHEAMAARPDEEAESGTVVEVYQQGYRLNGSVLRPARVVVAQ